jgi:signal recognition particle GTPase
MEKQAQEHVDKAELTDKAVSDLEMHLSEEDVCSPAAKDLLAKLRSALLAEREEATESFKVVVAELTNFQNIVFFAETERNAARAEADHWLQEIERMKKP